MYYPESQATQGITELLVTVTTPDTANRKSIENLESYWCAMSVSLDNILVFVNEIYIDCATLSLIERGENVNSKVLQWDDGTGIYNSITKTRLPRRMTVPSFLPRLLA